MKARFPLFIPGHIVVHHSASPVNTRYETIERWHTAPKPKGNGWSAIGYNHVIGDGWSRPGRVVPQRGAGVRGHNTGTINVLLTGDNTREDRRWTQWQVDQAKAYVEAAMMVWPHIGWNQVMGHRDLAATLCPGLDVGSLIRDFNWNLTRYWNAQRG